MKLLSRIITPPIRGILSLLCRVDASELRKIPRRGPAIIVLNHVNFLEVPMIYTFLFPREAIGMVKVETWENPLLAFLAYSWDAIALNRETTDLAAMRAAMETLKERKLLLLAPEGTRSKDGKLQKGHAGVIQIALKSGAPIYPVAHSGGEVFWSNFKRGRRTAFRFRVGEPFTLRIPQTEDDSPGQVGRELRQQMTDAMMNRLALLLPQWQRGAYPEPEQADYSCLCIKELS